MLSGFEEKIAEFVRSQGLFASNNRVVLAISGGADSISLLYAMAALKGESQIHCEFICGHINHSIRGAQSDADEKFVIEQAGKLGFQAATRRVDVPAYANREKISIETAGRMLRTESLIDIAASNDCDCIVTAHHKDDNAETLIQRLGRGTGFRGLGGIWPVRKFGGVDFARPLLCVRRAEIVEYLQQGGLKWRTDRTNEDLKHRRNFIRHRLLPNLQNETEGSLALILCQLAQAARSFYMRVCNRADELTENGLISQAGVIELDTEMFAAEHPEVQVEMFRRALLSSGSGERDFSSEHYERILGLIKSGQSSRAVELPGGYLARYEYGKMLFSKRDTQVKTKENSEVCVEVPGRTEFGACLIEAEVFETGQKDFEQFKQKKDAFVEWFDFEKIAVPLIVRTRRTGDRFWPLGHEAEKKIGKFLTAAKVRRQIRKKSLVVADTEKIIWVWPVRISEQAKVTKETKKILQLQIKSSET